MATAIANPVHVCVEGNMDTRWIREDRWLEVGSSLYHDIIQIMWPRLNLLCLALYIPVD